MNRHLVLPPKRFCSVLSPIYDPIRHFPWFHRLQRRKWQLDALKSAHYEILAYSDKTQRQVAEKWGVDGRELRDFISYVNKRPKDTPKQFQWALDQAYEMYVFKDGSNHIRNAIDDCSSAWGLSPRHVIEAWETDANFWPTGYPDELKGHL